MEGRHIVQNSDSGRKDRAVGLPGWQVSLLSAPTQARTFLSLQNYTEMPASKAGSLRHPSKGASLLKIRIYSGMSVIL